MEYVISSGLAGDVAPSKFAVGFVVLFCRIGACIMLAPGVSSIQIPVHARLYVGLGVTFALSPLLFHRLPIQSLLDEPAVLVKLIVVEVAVGVVIGLLARVVFMALQGMTAGIATMLGFSNPFGVQIEANDVLPPLATFISFAATGLIFFTDLHFEILKGVVISYEMMPVGSEFRTGFALGEVVDASNQAFRLSLRVTSPFFVYAVTVNFVMALINRLTPQISIYYLSSPFIIGGALFLLLFVIKPLLAMFEAGFAAALKSG